MQAMTVISAGEQFVTMTEDEQALVWYVHQDGSVNDQPPAEPEQPAEEQAPAGS